jgi:hypothetical protein
MSNNSMRRIKHIILIVLISSSSWLIAGRFTDVCTTIKQEISKQLCANSSTSSNVLFERGEGFWSNPDDESKQDFFGKLTDAKSQREDWYTVSPYIAEFLCTISNIGFIYVGIKHNSPELLFAGVASALSHSIPKQWLNIVDKIGVLFVLSKVLREYNVIKNNPIFLTHLGALGILQIIDAYMARNQGKTLPHVVWHLSAALVAHEFLKLCKKQ